ncbi:MAG: sigma-70 family RNA polymerase sigma factor [Thermomicrobiales bacterium]
MYGSAPAPQLASNQIREATPEDVAEAELVARAQHDPRAFAPLYTRYADPVYRYCFRRLGSEEAAADATSAIFAKALAALPRYRTGSFRSWLFTIAHNTIVDGLRVVQVEALPETVDEPIDPSPTPEEAAMTADAGRELRAALAHLSGDQRRVVELRLAGLTDQEIAQVTGRSLAATRMVQVRAVARLRRLLLPHGGREGGSHVP